MADRMTEKQKVKEITDRLEDGLKELFESDRYKRYLDTMSKFHNYSANNIQLIFMQRPDATLVAGLKAWEREHERYVNKGESGISILAPAPYEITVERQKIDPVTREPMLDRDGIPVMGEVRIKKPAYRVVTVFDVAQTYGEPLPELGVKELQGEVENYQDLIKALEVVSPFPVGYEKMEGDKNGYTSERQRRIAIKEGMSEAQTFKTGIHEIAHAKLHMKELEKDAAIPEYKDREEMEVEAESIAYTVCQHFGIDTSDYSFGYIAGWSSGKDMKELKSSLNTIRQTSSELIKGIEAQLFELEREREAMQEREDAILLVANTDYTEYDLLRVRGVEKEELFNTLLAMTDNDRQNVEAYLEREGAWAVLLGNERSEDVEEYHLDYAFNTDTHEITDFKAMREWQEKAKEPIGADDVILKLVYDDGELFEIDRIVNKTPGEVNDILKELNALDDLDWEGDVEEFFKEHGMEYVQISHYDGKNPIEPQFYDFELNLASKELTKSAELPAVQQAEYLINRMEHGATKFTDDERNLVINYAYKLDDMDNVRQLVETLAVQEENFPNLIAQTVINAQAEIDSLPDGMVGLSEMHKYGYSWNEMLPLTKDRAAELFSEDVAVYRLHADGSETLVEDKDGLQGHDGMFGVEKSDWSAYLEYQTMKQGLEESVPEREAKLLYGNEDQFGIYQLKDIQETRDIRFMALDYLEMKGVAVSKDNYDLVYTGELKEGMSLEDIYTKFNIDHPADFTGHSLSVSDVVVLHQGGENTSHYVDAVGYSEVPEFTKELSVTAEIENEEIPPADKVSYYVIEDLSTWADGSQEKSSLERFDSLVEAMGKFSEYKGKDVEDKPDMARATLGMSVNGVEFDVIHVRNGENCLSLDFTHSKAEENSQFMDDLQILYNEVGFDKVRVHRDMSPEEVKGFVKQRFEHQLKSSGIDDVSLYMGRFDALYEQGKMEHLMPTENQKHIEEDLLFMEWENPYIGVNYKYADIIDKELSVMEYLSLLGMEQSDLSIDGLMEALSHDVKLWDYPMEEKDYCLQENIPVVAVRDGEMARYFEIPEELVKEVRNREFRGYEPETELAFQLADRYISIQEVSEGYDYTIYDMNYRELDGGVYDNPEITIRQALDEIVADLKEPMHRSELEGNIHVADELIPIDYEELAEKTEQAAKEQLDERIAKEVPEAAESKVINDFKAKTDKMFNDINGQKQDDIELSVYAYLQSKIDEYEIDIELVDMAVSGSRCRGLEKAGSDLDVVVEYRGRENEDDLFNAFNEDGFMIGGIKVDINPIMEGKTGTLATYLPGVEAYLEEKRAAMQEKGTELKQEEKHNIVTLTVAECGEFHNLGEYHEDISGVDEAIAIFNRIPPERMNGIPSIGINIHTPGTEAYEDTQLDILSGRLIDLEMLDYVPEIINNPEAVAVIAELIEKIPDAEVLGSLPEHNSLAKVEELEEENLNMIDGVLNSEKPKTEHERPEGRISVKEKLAEKKAVIEQCEKGSKPSHEKETEKKPQREI